MVWLTRVVIIFALAAPLICRSGQDQEPVPDGDYEFVSGTVSELPPGKIVVNRAVLGKPAENRAFLITGVTKIEGKLELNARVTVGFKPSDEGDVAIRIIVRPHPNGKKP
jgi:hypothetical protein